MLRINRVRVEIDTAEGTYGIDTSFTKWLTFLSSEENTCGKSSILAAIYYNLGLEEIIGGRGEKVLTSVFKTTVEDGDKVLDVLQSCIYLEISNGTEAITLFRPAKMKNMDSRLIRVYFSSMDSIKNPETLIKDTYVHQKNAAKSDNGFHKFLEDFLHLELPNVTATDDMQRKLYLQLVFSCMFIEQKHGWADLFSGMPILGIKEAKKRVIEFVLNLDTLRNARKKEELNTEEQLIIQEWDKVYNIFQESANRESCTIINVPFKPKILSDVDIAGFSIQYNGKSLSDTISELERQLSGIKKLKPKVGDNFADLQKEMETTEEEAHKIEKYISSCMQQLSIENGSINAIKKDLETIAIDLTNNKDAARLRSLGSNLKIDFANDRCPICHHKISDSLLPNSIDVHLMSIDENIKHLEAQEKMFKFALHSHLIHKKQIEDEMKHCESRLFTLRGLAKSIRNDLYSINEEHSEAIIYKKITIEKQIENLSKLQQIQSQIQKTMTQLSERWKIYLEEKSKLPKDKFTKLDEEKLKLLRSIFISNLRTYRYESIYELEDINISRDSYLPIYEGFDMKFDSSASDNIRVIWAFTMALLQVSLDKGGNHPTVLIFDEPDQQSTIIDDVKAFFTSVLKLENKCQIIMGITLKDAETKNAINSLSSDKYQQINVQNKAFRLISKDLGNKL